jgi:putative transposase
VSEEEKALSGHGTRDWPHAPPHRLEVAGVYFVTARTRERLHYFRGDDRLGWLCDRLQDLARRYAWKLEAWAVFSNHYHFVAHAPGDGPNAASLVCWLKHLHADTSRHVNKLDQTPGRQVWQNYRETLLTHHRSYLSRLNYTHHNAVHHRLVAAAARYPWCSAAFFEKACTKAWVETVYSFPYDQVAEADGD